MLARMAELSAHESEIQKYLNPGLPGSLPSGVKRCHVPLGKTPCVTYALTCAAPCTEAVILVSVQRRGERHSIKSAPNDVLVFPKSSISVLIAEKVMQSFIL